MGARTQMNLADLLRWAFMSNPSHVLNTEVPDSGSLEHTLLETDLAVLLFFAASHGLHGVLSVIEDYLSSSRSAQRFYVDCLS